VNEIQQEAVLTICLMAAFADGSKGERERAEVRRITESLAPGAGINLPALMHDVLLERRSLQDAADALGTPGLRNLAYEMAVCVCDADGGANAAESAFMERLRTVLGLEAEPAREFAETAAEVATAPLAEGELLAAAGSADDASLDKMILNYSILNGALELLPQSMASMAVIPLQMKMVYRVGKAHGYELDRGHVKDLLTTLGVGLTGQYIEQIGRKLLGGLLGKAAGGLAGSLGKVVTGAAFSFATTYALGQVARRYYGGGRQIDSDALKQTFAAMLEEGKGLQSRYAGDIEQRARSIDVKQLANLVRRQ
jgi:uncharacterized protein (DUF697 family)/tellurite resistance protein